MRSNNAARRSLLPRPRGPASLCGLRDRCNRRETVHRSNVAYGFCLRGPTQLSQGPISLAMTLASCHDRNMTRSERRVESAFRLVNHPVNLTPMWNGLLPSSDSTTFLGPRARSSREPSECVHQFQPSSPRRMRLVEHTESSHTVTAYWTCAQTETTLHSTRRRLRSQAPGPLRLNNV